MHCPLCRHELEVGTLALRAGGYGASPQAVLFFNGEQLLEHTYFPVVGLFSKGTQRTAVRCSHCTFVGFVADEGRCTLSTDGKTAESRP